MENHALRLAVDRGLSAKLEYVRVNAQMCFRFLAQLPISKKTISTTETDADIMTKVLSALRDRELCRPDFDLDAVPEASVMAPRSDVQDGKVWVRRKPVFS